MTSHGIHSDGHDDCDCSSFWRNFKGNFQYFHCKCRNEQKKNNNIDSSPECQMREQLRLVETYDVFKQREIDARVGK